MKIGINTRIFARSTLASAIQKIAELGFNAVEIWANFPQLDFRDFNQKALRTLKKLVGSYNLAVAIHVPEYDLNIASPNSLAREMAIRAYLKTVELASEIESKIVTIHLGRQSSATIIPRKEQWNYCKEGIVKVLDFSKGSGVIIAIENMSPTKNLPYFGATVEELLEIIEESGPDKDLGITLDAGHANLAGKLFLSMFIKKLGKYIVHTHLHDNNGLEDQHLPLGMGRINYENFLQSLGKVNYKGMLNLEIQYFEDPEGAALRSKAFLEEKLNEIESASGGP